jgi:hypothetical protein
VLSPGKPRAESISRAPGANVRNLNDQTKSLAGMASEARGKTLRDHISSAPNGVGATVGHLPMHHDLSRGSRGAQAQSPGRLGDCDWGRPRRDPLRGPRAATDEQLVLYQQGLGHDNTYSARAHEFCNGGQQVDGEYEQVNHRHGR